MNRTREYEAMIILRSGGTEQELAQHAAKLEEPIKKLGGKVDSVQPMGRRRLAFRIARHNEGCYYVVRFHAPTGQIGELERLFRLNDAIVRCMILSEDELAPLARQEPAPGRAAASAPAAAATRN